MRVRDILDSSEGTRFSLEVYPPKAASSPTGTNIQQEISDIFDTVEHLRKYDPAFVSVTYNPEGKTRATSIPIAAIIKQRFKVEAVAHLTCINTQKKDLAKTLDVIRYFDIENVMALRGDPPKGYAPRKDCLMHADELVAEIKAHSGFCIGVASYPDVHPECTIEGGDGGGRRDAKRDMENFKRKVGNGADFSVTQLFYDNKAYFDFVDRARKEGIEIPIIPGIMPVINKNIIGIVKGLCGVGVPPAFEKKLLSHEDDPKEVAAIGAEHAIAQCKGLMDKVPDIHFYTMDQWRHVERIIEGLK
jgi:methylenetetrahydrofolate reductase (NADPH)